MSKYKVMRIDIENDEVTEFESEADDDIKAMMNILKSEGYVIHRVDEATGDLKKLFLE